MTDVTINGVSYGRVSLDNFTFPALVKGDKVSYTMILPETDIRNPSLAVYLDHSSAVISVDGEKVFEHRTPDSFMVGYGTIYQPLKNDYAGKTATIEIVICENENMTKLVAPEICDKSLKDRNFILDNLLNLVVAISILSISFIIMVAGAFFSGSDPSFRKLAYLGIAFFLMGLWELCSYKLIFIFTDSIVFKCYVEYSSLYIGPFFLALYFNIEFFENESDKLRHLYSIVVFVQGLFPVAAYVLHFTNTRHLPELLTYGHLIMFVNITMVLVVIIKQFIAKTSSHKIMMVGLALIIGFALLDLGRFYYYKYMNHNSDKNYNSTLLVGFFVFLITMILDFLINQQRSLVKAAQAETMNRLAHVDIMTNLANRRRCEEAFDRLRNSSDVYGMISIDINYLKQTNDNYGHQEGDRLLTDFSGLLASVFTDESYTVGRMGGDEFIVIIPGANEKLVDDLLNKLVKRQNEINKTRKPFGLSFAYGYSLSTDSELKKNDLGKVAVEDVYRLADARMYETKVAMKKAAKAAETLS